MSHTRALLAALSTVLVMCSALAAPPQKLLSPVEEAVTRSPFAPQSSRPLLRTYLESVAAKHRMHLMLPRVAPPDAAVAGIMGWRMKDMDYWRSIPEAAKTLPVEWSHLPTVRYTNSQLGGTREISFAAGPEYDFWLLKDPTHSLFACISVHRKTKRVYFMEVSKGAAGADAGRWVYHAAFDNCFSCHPSGPRMIRPLDEKGVDRGVLATFNRRLLAYHACDFGDAVDPGLRGAETGDAGCRGCHDGVSRGKLYDINRQTIDFKTETEKTMPPAPPGAGSLPGG